MDITLTKVIQFMTGLFMPLWIIGVVVIFIYTFLAQREVFKGSKHKIFSRILVGVAMVFVLAFICCGVLQDYFANKTLNSFAAGHLDSLVIQSKSKHIEISDPAFIRELFSIIKRGQKVSAHHSQSVDRIKLILPRAGYTYSLGKDSEVKDEFWFDWVSYSGSDPNVSLIRTVRQFRSSELSAWLKQNVGNLN